MKYRFIDSFPNEFLKGKTGPHISIYQDTSKLSSENKQHQLVFKNLSKDVISLLKKHYSDKDIKSVITLLNNLVDEQTFWSKTKAGIALFATLDECVIYNLETSPKNTSFVADSFYVKPLIKYNQLLQKYHLLDIDGKKYQVYEGSQFNLNKLDIEDVSSNTLKELVGTELSESYMTHGSYGSAGGRSKEATFHGHGGKDSEIAIDLERFFRESDKIITKEISNKKKLPLVLLAPDEHQSLFFDVSNNNYLEKETINGSFDKIDDEVILNKLKEIAKNKFDKKVSKALEEYHNLYNDNKSTDNLNDIIKATLEGRIDTLFVAEDKIVNGEIDTVRRKLVKNHFEDPQYDDILNDLAQLALDTDSTVYVLNSDKIPSSKGIAAIYRY